MTFGLEADEAADIVDELSQMEHDFVSLESSVRDLDGLSQRISLEGIGRSDASTIMAYGEGIISDRYPLNAFTSNPSKTNLVPALEGLMGKVQEILSRIFEAIAEFITGIGNWIKDKLLGAKTAEDLKDVTDEWKKSVDQRIKAVEARLAKLERDKALSDADKVEAKRNVDDFVNQRTPAQQETKRRRDEAYNVLAQVAVNHTDKVIYLMDSLSAFPLLRDNISMTIKTIEATLNLYDRRPDIESLMTALGSTNDLTNRFNERLKEICVKINRTRVPQVDFGYYDPEHPDEFLTRVRNNLMVAGRTPVGKSFLEDYAPGYLGAHPRIIAISESAVKVSKFIDKNDTLAKDLTELSKRLRVAIKRIRTLHVEISPEQIEIRGKLLDISRLLRRSLFAYMRLREIPLSIINHVGRFVEIEANSEDDITEVVKK